MSTTTAPLKMKGRSGRLAIAAVVAGLAATAAALGVRAAEGGAAITATQPGPRIAFVRTDLGPPYASHIFVMNPDGSGLRQLTDSNSFDWNETWSPDGSRLLFDRLTRSSSSGPYQSDIYVVRADDSRLQRLTDSGSSWGASWSPDGRTIAYGKETGLLLMNADGSRKRQLTQVNRRHAWAGDPSWSPDGKRITFGTGDGVIFVVNADGTGKRRLTHWTGGGGPVWSPHGDLIAFAGGSPGHRYGYIYVLNADRSGGRVRLVTRHAYNESGFAWSPNGRRIVYARENRGGVYVINADGTHDRRLRPDPLRADLLAGGFSWSPDRNGLAFASDRSGNGDIYVMNFLSNDEQQLTEGLAIDGSPRWSP